VVGVQQVDINEVNKYGVLIYEDMEKGKIKGISEKPSIDNAPNTSAALGRYIFKPEIFDELAKISKVNGEYLITDAMINLMQKQDFYDCKFKGDHYDIGNPLGYLKANVEFGLNRDDIREGLNKYLIQISNQINSKKKKN
jgi:UTP--glucose-1-phosphate uridylyltransferase